jgi:3-hydroxyacyl-CoA dehydrogenase/3a,7a,12a-trihydroxy-5b-cholest-24-enoyl-CoA hydratase
MASLTSEEIFAAMGQAAEGDDSIKRKFKACVVFDVDGDERCLDVKNGTLIKGRGENADLKVKTSLATLQQLLQKELTPQQAFMKGKLKIKGNMGLAMKLTVVLAGTRKYLPTLAKL